MSVTVSAGPLTTADPFPLPDPPLPLPPDTRDGAPPDAVGSKLTQPIPSNAISAHWCA